MQESLVTLSALLADPDAPGWLVRNGLVWGALIVFLLLLRFRPRPAQRKRDRYFMGMLAGGVAALAFEWMA